jgi:hypothetical protein
VFATFWAIDWDTRLPRERRVEMKLRRIKRTHTTPKSQTKFTDVSFELGGGLNRLLKTVAKIIEKYFGILYMVRLHNVTL